MTAPTPLQSIPGIIEIVRLTGAAAAADARPDLLIEIPHGATATIDFTALAARLSSPLPAGLVDFFHVNTDVGAPELAEAVAERFVAAEPARTAVILRCRIPRTFIDCNRRIDASAEDFKAGKVTPGLMPWVTSPEDRSLLRAAYERYLAAVAGAAGALAPDGALLLLHSYAPRDLDVEVDLDIVASLHRGYAPDIVETWPMRPPLDVIGKGMDGTNYAPPEVVETLRAEMAALELEVADSATYPLHPSTIAHDHVMAHPGRTLCLEVRRDLLADPFDPFVEMRIGPAKVARLATPIVTALRRWW